jgi:O-antigen/teichoic acid export membrane protein
MRKMAGVKHNLTANLYGTSIAVVGQIILVPFFLRYWGQTYYGQWLVLSAVPAYLALSDIGISNALGNEFSIAVERGEGPRARNLLGAVWRFQTWFSLGLVLLMALALAVLPMQDWLRCATLQPRDFTTILFLLTAYSLLPLQIASFSGVYRAAEAYPEYLLIQGHMRLLEVVGTAVVLWAHGTMVGLATLLVFLRLLWLSILAVRSNHLLPTMVFSWSAGSWADFRTLLPAGAGFFAFPVGNALINQGVTLVVNTSGGPGAVVVLSVCRQVGRAFLQVSSILFTSLHPELTTAYARNDLKRMRQLQSGAVGLTVLVGAVFSVGAFFLGGTVIHLWTGMAAVPGIVIGLFALEAVSASLGNLALVVPWAASRLRSLPIAYLLTQALSLLAGWLAFPSTGVAAIGAGFLAGNLVFGWVALRQSLEELNCHLPGFVQAGWASLRVAGATLRLRFS